MSTNTEEVRIYQGSQIAIVKLLHCNQFSDYFLENFREIFALLSDWNEKELHHF